MGRRKQRVRWTSVEEAFFGQANIESEESGNLAPAAATASPQQQVIMVVNDETALPQVTKLDRTTVDIRNPNVLISDVYIIVWLSNCSDFTHCPKSKRFCSDFRSSVNQPRKPSASLVY